MDLSEALVLKKKAGIVKPIKIQESKDTHNSLFSAYSSRHFESESILTCMCLTTAIINKQLQAMLHTV